MKKILFKGIAFLLTLSMGLLCLPESLRDIFSNEVQEIKAKAEVNTENVVKDDSLLKESTELTNVQKESYVLSENIKKREINKKYFNMSDGTILVEQYPVAVHYLDCTTGKYEEIDNSLVETTENGRNYYQNAANDFKIKIQETAQPEEELIEITKGNCRLGFELVSESTLAKLNSEMRSVKKQVPQNIKEEPRLKEVKANVKASKVKEKFKKEKQEFSYKEKKVETPQYSVSPASGVTYENIWTGTDLEYEVHASQLKENIIVKEKAQDYRYTFKLNTEGLELVLNEDGSISALDAENSEVFSIPAPFMTDAAGVYSEAVEYSLENTGDYWYLTLTADSDWINDEQTAFPVTIDPIIETTDNGRVITSATVYERNKATEINQAQAYAGKNMGNNCGLSNAYILMDYMGLPNDYILTAGSLKYTFQAKGDFPAIIFAYGIAYEIYTIDSDVYLNNLTYNNLPEKRQFLYSTDETFTRNKVFTRTCSFDISYIKEGRVAFGFYGPNTDNKTYIGLYTSGENAPVLQLRYRLSLGLGDNSVTETFEDVGITNYVNVFSKQLTSVIDCMEVNSEIMPLNVQAIYNASYDAYRENAFANSAYPSFTTSHYGKCFKLNFEQYCVPYDFDGDGNEEGYLYVDSGGGYHHFAPSSTANKYLCEDCQLGYLYVSATAGWVCNRDEKSLYFENGRLSRIQNSEYQTIRINYDSNGRIAKIYNCVSNGTANAPASTQKQYINFYYTNNLLSSIKSNYGEQVNFTYDSSGKLIKISRFSHQLATFEYDRFDMLWRIIGRENSGYTVGYLQHGSGYVSTWKVESINRVENYLSSSPVAEYTVFSGDGIWCRVRNYKKGEESWVNFYVFNEIGQCKLKYQQYDGKQDETEPRNFVTVCSKTKTGNLRTNTQLAYEEDFSMIVNGSFENITGKNPTGWTVTTSNTGNNYSTRDSGKALVLFGNSSARRDYDFRKAINGDYVLGFYADGWGNDCKVKVTLTPNSNYPSVGKKEVTYKVSYGTGYYAGIIFPKGTAVHYGTVMIENITSSGSKVVIDNITLSPLSSLTKNETNINTLTTQLTERTLSGVYTVALDKYSRVTTERFLDYYNNKEKVAIYTYSGNTQRVLKQVYDTDTVEYTYNSQGQPTQAIKTSTLNGTALKQIVKTEYNDLGLPTKMIDENGVKNYYFYGITQDNYRLIKFVKCLSTAELVAGASHDSHTTDYVETYTYDEYGNLSQLNNNYAKNIITDFNGGQEASYAVSGGAQWKFNLDANSNLKSITDASQNEKINYTYNSNQQLTQKAYEQSGSVTQYDNYTYDKYGNVASITCTTKDMSTATPTLRTDDSYTSAIDYKNYKQTITSNGMAYVYQDNYLGNLLNSRVDISGMGYAGAYTYYGRLDGLLQKATYTINGLTRTYTPQYNDKKQITSEVDGNHHSAYTYDALGRVMDYDITTGDYNILDLTYSYKTRSVNSTSYATNQIYEIVDNANSGNTLKYLYDNQGRITSQWKGGATEAQYTYDQYDKLKTETNDVEGKSYAYTYDNNYNIKSVSITPKSSGATQAEEYTYNNWDQLTAFKKNGTTQYYVYDNLGNPVKYGVNSTSADDNMVWTQGRKLTSGVYKGNTFSYKYDADGMRYEKTVNGLTTRYYLEEGQVLAEEQLNSSGGVASKIYYIYNQNGIAGMYRNGSTYYFRKDGLGNITEIINYSKEVVATYTYDAWGNCTITNKTSANIGTINPFRYRGYYQDNETGFYYLQTRYYDPEIRRFINADNLELIPLLTQRVGQLNLYAYCNDNPVSYTDESGTIVGVDDAIFWGAVFIVTLITTAVVESQTHMIYNAVTNIGNVVGNAVAQGFGDLYDLFNCKKIEILERDTGRRDTDLAGIPTGDLQEEYEKARRAGDSKRAARIQREQKIRGNRNRKKRRGGPHMRGWWVLLLLGMEEVIRDDD